MVALSDLFNPTFLMFLGILVLAVALLVVYFESKMREQNHKIASVVSLVSTLADDMNGVKIGLNHFIMSGGHMLHSHQVPILNNNLGNAEEKKELIVVSDDEESNYDSDNEDSDNEDSDNEDADNEDADNEDSENVVIDDSSEIDIYQDSSDDSNDEKTKTDKNIKILKLNVINEEKGIEANNDFDLEENVDFGDFDAIDELPEIGDDYVEEVLDLKYNEDSKNVKPLEEHKDITSSDFKTISIHLGEENNNNNEGNIDYKKLQLQKLRSIIVEKGLANNIDVSKLKKHELLKLLTVE